MGERDIGAPRNLHERQVAMHQVPRYVQDRPAKGAGVAVTVSVAPSGRCAPTAPVAGSHP
jgi:hypothetical protein